MINNILKLSFAILFSLPVGASPASDLAANLKNLNTFAADFKQSTKTEHGAEVSSSTGHFVFERPDHLYWHTTQPDDLLVVGDGKTLWHYDVSLDQVIRQNFSTALANAPVIFLTGDPEKFLKAYKIESLANKSCGAGVDTCFKLMPNDPQQAEKEGAFSFLRVWIGFNKQALSLVRLEDQLSQSTYISFDNSQLNKPVDPQLFIMNIPAGVEVLEQ